MRIDWRSGITSISDHSGVSARSSAVTVSRGVISAANARDCCAANAGSRSCSALAMLRSCATSKMCATIDPWMRSGCRRRSTNVNGAGCACTGAAENDSATITRRRRTPTARRFFATAHFDMLCELRELCVDPPMGGRNGNVRIVEIAPGAFHLARCLTLDEQRAFVERCRALVDGAVPAYVPTVRGGGKMHVRMLCLGRHWKGQSYRYA